LVNEFKDQRLQMSLQIRQTVSFDNACEKNSSLRSSQERKEVNKMSIKVLVVFVLCLIAVCKVQSQDNSTTTAAAMMSTTPGDYATTPAPVMTTEKSNATTTSSASSLTATFVLVVSALALLC
jgi:hypothetical protein